MVWPLRNFRFEPSGNFWVGLSGISGLALPGISGFALRSFWVRPTHFFWFGGDFLVELSSPLKPLSGLSPGQLISGVRAGAARPNLIILGKVAIQGGYVGILGWHHHHERVAL